MLRFAAGMATGLVAGAFLGKWWAFNGFLVEQGAKMDTAIAQIRAGQVARDSDPPRRDCARCKAPYYPGKRGAFTSLCESCMTLFYPYPPA